MGFYVSTGFVSSTSCNLITGEEIIENVFFHNYGSDTWHLPPPRCVGINKAIAAGVLGLQLA